jgi:hypothetical protein
MDKDEWLAIAEMNLRCDRVVAAYKADLRAKVEALPLYGNAEYVWLPDVLALIGGSE